MDLASATQQWFASRGVGRLVGGELGVVKMWSRSRRRGERSAAQAFVTCGFAVSLGSDPNQRYRLLQCAGRMAAPRIARADLLQRRATIASGSAVVGPPVRTWQHDATPATRCRQGDMPSMSPIRALSTCPLDVQRPDLQLCV